MIMPASDLLGLDRPISRRDFLSGARKTIGAAVVTSAFPREILANAALDRQADHYPPCLTGFRGTSEGSADVAHALRDGTFWNKADNAIHTGETYDLVVVGGGISGLAAAFFFRERAGRCARILVLESEDDFGGHARRNEFHLDRQLQVMNGGTMGIDSPKPYSFEADRLIRALGVDPEQFDRKYSKHNYYRSLGLIPGVFFDRETFGEDKLVIGDPGSGAIDEAAEIASWTEFLARTPLGVKAQEDIARIQTAIVDYMPDLPSKEKKERLAKISYQQFLLEIVGASPEVIPFYRTLTHGNWGVGIDAKSALDCWGFGLAGFQGMHLDGGAAPRMSYTAAGYANGGSYKFHFPDGNASIARLLARALVPHAFTGSTAEDIVTANVRYGTLDQAHTAIRIRLNSMVVRVGHLGEPSERGEVEVQYVGDHRLYSVRARSCVLACWNMVIPYICPELPEIQKMPSINSPKSH
jgi:spermidine dehydrogenase